MNVLIADDEPMTRALLRRVLTRDCGCTVSEAADGLAALSSCGSTPPDLVITDLRMPVMDGIELIQALRQVPALAAIPVVMMTAAREQAPVHRAIELGVTDYLLKPLQADRVADRLRAVVERVTRAADAPADDRSPVLVADGNAEFRQAVALAASPTRQVHQAQSGVAALQRAVETRPGLVLVGGDLGLLGPELLIRKLRAAGELAGMRIVAVVARGDTAIPDQADAILVRSSSPEELRARLQAASASAVRAGGVLSPSLLRSQVAIAADQVLGLLLRLDVQHSFEVEPRPVERLITASVTLAVADAPDVLTMTLRTDLPSAAAVAAGMASEGAAPPTGDEAAVAAAAEVLGLVAGRIKTGLEAAGRTVALPAPVSRLAGAGDLSEGAEGRMQVTLQTAERGAQFVVQLASAPAAADARSAASAARADAS